MSLGVYLAVAACSFTLSVLLVKLSISYARRLGFLDAPDGIRKTQQSPIPKLGGVAVAVAFSVMLLALSLFTGQMSTVLLLAGVLIPALLMAALGFLDDHRPISPWIRLVVQALIGGCAWLFGTRVQITGSTSFDLVITVLWIVAVVNAMNMLDNSDGLAASTTVIISGTVALIAGALTQYLIAALAWSLFGVAAGFLWHNWHPARVYLGDAGSYFLGFILAVEVIRLRPISLGSGWSVAVPLLLLALPLSDMLFVVSRRLLVGKHPFTAGRDHLSHALQRTGAGVPRSVLILLGVTGATCLSGALLVLASA